MKNILVFGGSSGIGNNIVNTLSQDKNNIINISRRNINSVMTVQCDVGVEQDLKKAIDSINSVFIDGIDEIYYCIGVEEKSDAFIKQELNYIDNLININSIAFCKTMSLLINSLNSGASIVVLSSTHSLRAAKHNPIYSATKGFIDAFVRSYSQTLISYCDKNNIDLIRINAVNPEIAITPLVKRVINNELLVKTEKTRIMKRFLKISEIVSVMIFLNSSDASGITGSTHKIGGEI